MDDLVTHAAKVFKPAPQYTYDDIYAAMCLWEEITGPTHTTTPWKDYREAHGTPALRGAVIKLARPCDEAWSRACARSQVDTTTPEPGAFDWEFVPFWIRNCVDWSGAEPRVLGSAA